MFDRLVESTNERRGARTWIFFAASSLTWTILLAGVAVAGVILTDLQLDAGFDKLNLVALSPPGPAAARTRTPAATTSTAPDSSAGFRAVVRPNETILPPRPVAMTGPLVPFSVGNGDPYSTGPGDPRQPFGPGGGGTPEAGAPVPAPAPPPPVAETKPVPPPSQIRPRHIGVISGLAIRRVEPAYPRTAADAGISGSVVVSVTVSEAGRVIDANAVSGNPLLRTAAVDAARRWQFTPTILNGIPTKVIGTITFNFKRT